MGVGRLYCSSSGAQEVGELQAYERVRKLCLRSSLLALKMDGVGDVIGERIDGLILIYLSMWRAFPFTVQGMPPYKNAN